MQAKPTTQVFGIGLFSLVVGLLIWASLTSSDEHGWPQQSCTANRPSVVDTSDEDSASFEVRAVMQHAHGRSTIPLTMEEFGTRAEAERAAEQMSNTARDCWVSPDDPNEILAEEVTVSNVVIHWLITLVVMAHGLLLVRLEVRDRRFARWAQPLQHAPPWLPPTLVTPPPGFAWHVVKPPAKGSPYRNEQRASPIELTFRAQGRGALMTFLAVFSAPWASIAVAGPVKLFHGEWFDALLMILLGGVVSVFVLRWFYRLATTALQLEIHPDRIRGSVIVAGHHEPFESTRASVRAVVQRFDADKSDSFPTWGLILKAKRSIELLGRQSPDKSEWLGQVLAAWAEVAFTPDQSTET